MLSRKCFCILNFFRDKNAVGSNFSIKVVCFARGRDTDTLPGDKPWMTYPNTVPVDRPTMGE